MAKILVAFDTVDEGFERLTVAHEVIRPPKGTDFSQEELQRLIVDCDVLCSVFDIHIGKELMQRGNRLHLVANYAVGYNNIDIAAARQLGIAVTNTPLSVIEPTAELAMALMLSCSRRTAELDRALRSSNGKLGLGRLGMMGMDLYGQTLGIVGYGNIGAAVARRAKAFGMKVLYYKRTRLSQDEETERGITYATLADLLKASDVVSLHTPYSPQTHHQIDARALALMKPSALLINTARGSIVDEDALIAALSSGGIAGAGLDVFEDSDVPRSALLDLPNVVLTPHVGTQTYEARCRMVHELVDNVLGFLAGSPNISRVDLL
ncbi:MAG: NAD(P)-dependent oxidoreductase [Porphyromonadaceae bacterium]|nr:NAD(P)-dependent oxidoreductase [Porphyromonadaceae bacterium]